MAQLPGLNIDWKAFEARLASDAFEALAVAAARRERRKQERLANDAKREAGIRKARGE